MCEKRVLTGFVVIMSLCAFIIIVSLDVLLSLFPNFDKGRLRRLLKQTPNTHLLLYELPLLILMIAVPIFVEESQIPILLDMFPNLWVNIGFWGLIMILLAYYNHLRFETFGLDGRREQLRYSILEESVEISETPDEAIEQALEIISNIRRDNKRASERGFLQYLITRNNHISEIATKKLDELTREKT